MRNLARLVKWQWNICSDSQCLIESYSSRLRRFSLAPETLPASTMKVLNVAEKNDASKNIAAILSNGASRRREGLSKFNKIYDFEYRLLGQNCTMIVTSVSGHLFNFEFPFFCKNWESIDPVVLFDTQVQKICLPNYEKIKKTLEREARQCQILVIWTDCDREGENIGNEIVTVCKAVKPSIRVYRAKFSEITRPSITRACENLGRLDERVSKAVDVRQELDLRIGAAFTRFQTLRFRKVFPNILGGSLISYGSCQFPTLGFVVERFKQIEAFIPEAFWRLLVKHTVEDNNVEFRWKRVHVFVKVVCSILLERCQETPKATVVSVKSAPKSKWRPLPLDTVEFEKNCSRKLHINAKQAMKIAETLYTQGFISYPRTETNIFPKELDLSPLVQMQTDSQQWGAFAARVLEDGITPRQGRKSDQAHPPIHPTKFTKTLQGNEKLIYEYIVRHFLACVSKDAQGFSTVVEIDIANEKFSANGLMIVAKNYLDVYVYEKWNDKNIPLYTVGQTFTPNGIEMIESSTEPPKLLTEADLITLMEKHGIGTDATHAEHIETIKSRTYVSLQNNRFTPAELGMGLVEGYDAMGFEMSKPSLRASLEEDLKGICEGTKDPAVVLREQINIYRNVFVQTMAQVEKLDCEMSRYLQQEALPYQRSETVAMTPTVIAKCPKCKRNDMVLRCCKDGKRFFIGCGGFPHCKSSIWFPNMIQTVTVTQDKCQTSMCRGKAIRKLKFVFNPGQVPPFYPPEVVGCIGGCDDHFMETLGIKKLF